MTKENERFRQAMRSRLKTIEFIQKDLEATHKILKALPYFALSLFMVLILVLMISRVNYLLIAFMVLMFTMAFSKFEDKGD